MKVLVGNQIDPAVRDRGELRAWTQRILWFAGPDDIVVLCALPDPGFLDHVTSLTGVKPSLLRIVVAPPGRHGGSLLDPESLQSRACVDAVAHHLRSSGVDDVSEVFALWPSPAVSRFADALGVADRFPGSAFFAQGGGELCNSKATFRAVAAAAGVPIPRGAVCRDANEAIAATVDLMAESGAVVVKQAHNGAGAGNQLVVQDQSLNLDRVGARHLHRLTDGRAGVETYWLQRWDWASAGGRHPVVVEEFLPHAASVYSEHYAADDRTWPTEMGTLHYVGRRLSHQTVPLRGVDPVIRADLLHGGSRLAQAYRSLGFRGNLSADAVLTEDGRVVFTEVNAQVSGSLHIYDVIARRVVDVAAAPERSVVEHHVPATWAVPDLTTFLSAADELGCGYDPTTRTGVIVSMPLIPQENGRAQFVFCLAYGNEANLRQMWKRLDDRFAVAPASASGRLGVAYRPR